MNDPAFKKYDLKELIALLKDQGLDITEDLARAIVQAVFNWLKMSSVASSSKVDDLLVMALVSLEPWIYEQIDKIDGQEG